MAIEEFTLVFTLLVFLSIIAYFIFNQRQIQDISLKLENIIDCLPKKVKRAGKVPIKEIKIEKKEKPELKPEEIDSKEESENPLISKLRPKCQILTQISPYGRGYEMKVNCLGCDRSHSSLEDCFFYDIDEVKVLGPNGEEFQLDKDFLVEPYSQDKKRRWILYGTEEEGELTEGDYTFEFRKIDYVVHSEVVYYSKKELNPPENLEWERRENDLFIKWNLPQVDEKISYNVMVWAQNENQDLVLSLDFDSDENEITLPNVFFEEGGDYILMLSVFSENVHTLSDYLYFSW